MPGFSYLSDQQLKNEIINIIQSIKSKFGQFGTAAEFADQIGLTIEEGNLPLGKDGIFLENEKTIILNSLVRLNERREFTIYHEIAHYLVRQSSDLYSYLHEAYEESDKFEMIIEMICNIGAAEFILPQEIVRNIIDQQGFSLRVLPLICEQHSVSGHAAFIQLVQSAPHHCYGVICKMGICSTSGSGNQSSFIEKKIKESLIVLYSIKSSSAKYMIRRNTRIPESHILNTGLQSEGLIIGRDRIPFRSNTNWVVPCEVLYYRGSVYGIFNVTIPPNNFQPRLFK